MRVGFAWGWGVGGFTVLELKMRIAKSSHWSA